MEALDYDPLRTRQRDSRKRIFREECLRELLTANGERSKIAAIAERVVTLAMDGDMRAVEFLADRIDGKVPQAIVGSDDEPPVMVAQIERYIVRHDNAQLPKPDARPIEDTDSAGVRAVTGASEI